MPTSVLEHVRRCWASLYSVESVTYRLRRGIPETDLAMAVVVQQMVGARSSGVMFTRSPLTGDRSVVAIDASWGLGSAVVSGDVTPDSFVVSKVTGEISRRTVATKTRWHQPDPSGAGVVEADVPAELRDVPSISDAEIAELVAIARRVEAHYGCPQDIEWAVDPAASPEESIVPAAEPAGDGVGGEGRRRARAEGRRTGGARLRPRAQRCWAASARSEA